MHQLTEILLVDKLWKHQRTTIKVHLSGLIERLESVLPDPHAPRNYPRTSLLTLRNIKGVGDEWEQLQI